MSKSTDTEAGSGDPRNRNRNRDETKHRTLTHKAPSATSGIADAVVAKHEDIFFLSRHDGCVPLRGRHGLGLYYHDCRYLDGYELKIAGTTLVPTMP